jgi:hypothetical protein
LVIVVRLLASLHNRLKLSLFIRSPKLEEAFQILDLLSLYPERLEKPLHIFDVVGRKHPRVFASFLHTLATVIDTEMVHDFLSFLFCAPQAPTSLPAGDAPQGTHRRCS